MHTNLISPDRCFQITTRRIDCVSENGRQTFWRCLNEVAIEGNLKSLSLPVTKFRKAKQNVQMGWFGVIRGHSMSAKIESFDIAHRSSYALYSNFVHLAPFLRYSEILVEN